MTNQETLADKLAREAVEDLHLNWPDVEKRVNIGFTKEYKFTDFLETKIRQATKEVKERLVLEKKEIWEHTGHYIDGDYCVDCNRDILSERGGQDYYGYNQAVKDLEDLKKTI